jgi:actin related protein 2/3 complex subunit 5
MAYAATLKARGTEGLGQVRSNPTAALKTVLDEMPVRRAKIGKEDTKGFEEAKAIALENVCQVILAIDQGKLASGIAALGDDERDTLMKFIYKGFESRKIVDGKSVPVYDCNILLKAHDAVCAKSGTGPIIRSIHTRLEV